MKSTARTALEEAALYSDGVEYKLVKLPANASHAGGGHRRRSRLPV